MSLLISIVNGILFGTLVAIGTIISTVFPLFLMLWRVETFSMNNQDRKKKTILGSIYPDFVYGSILLLLGLTTIGRGIIGVGTYSIESCSILICMGILFESIFLFPDKINCILPIEWKSRNGLIFMIILAIILITISYIII
jgi:hypothetical protein